MNVIEFLNDHWKDHYTGKYDSPVIEYFEHISFFLPNGKESFYYFYLQYLSKAGFFGDASIPKQDIEKRKENAVKWKIISNDFKKIKVKVNGKEEKSIDLDKDFQTFLRDRKKVSKDEWIFSPKEAFHLEKHFLYKVTNLALKINPEVFPKFEEEIHPKIAHYHTHYKLPKKGETRLCFNAWNQVYVQPDGGYTPCGLYNNKIWSNERERNSTEYRYGRQAMLDGKLNYVCATCDEKKIVTTQEFRKELETIKKKNKQSDLLDPLPISSVRIYITDNCNLRCVYCMVSEQLGPNIKEEAFEYALEKVKESSEDATIYLNGRGETTYHPKWVEYCTKLLNTGRIMYLNTNLAKDFSQEEIDLLAKMTKLWISLDSDNEDLMMKIRKKVKPENIYKRIRLIQESADRQGIKRPEIEISAGIYDPSIWELDKFIERVTKLDIDSVSFWNLREVTSNGLTRGLTHLNEEETKEARRIFRKAVDIAEKANLKILYSFDVQVVCSDGKPLLLPKENEKSKKRLSFFQKFVNKLNQQLQ